jgi:hypothetical protein
MALVRNKGLGKMTRGASVISAGLLGKIVLGMTGASLLYMNQNLTYTEPEKVGQAFYPKAE